MNLCIKDWNGVPHCTGSLMQRVHDTSPAAGFDSPLVIALIVLGSAMWFVFYNRA
jgi:hypothetical protein